MTTITLPNGTSNKDLQIREEREKLKSTIDRFNRDMKIRKPKLILLAILLDKARFVVDRSFYPSRSTLISVAWFMVKDKIIVVQEDFISSVYKLYRYPYAVELYRVLSFISTVDLILLIYPYPSIAIEIGVGSDCLLELHNLWSNKTIFLMSQYMHQVVKEIYLIKDK